MSRFRPVSHRIRAVAAATLLSTLPAQLRAQEPVAAPAAPAAAPAAPPTAQPVAPGDQLPPPAPGTDLPVQDVSEPAVTLTLRAPENVALYVTRQVEGARTERHCSGDCETSLAPGRYRFALARGLQRPVSAPGTFRLQGPDVIEARYDSQLGKRIVGGLVLGAGIPTGLAMFISGLKGYAALDEICDAEGDCHDEELDGALKANIVLGAVFMTASVALGSWLVTRKDHAHVELRRISANNGIDEPAIVSAPASEPPLPAEALVEYEATPAPAPAPAPAQGPVVSDLAKKVGLPPPSTINPTPTEALRPAPELEPAKPAAPPPLRKIEARIDLSKIGAHRAALSRCFPEKLTERVELRVDISSNGRLAGMGTSWPLAPRVEKCLQSALGRIQFDVGEPRTLRVNVAR